MDVFLILLIKLKGLVLLLEELALADISKEKLFTQFFVILV